MIFDSMNNKALYYGVNRRLQSAFDYLASVELEQMEPGRYVIDAEDIFMNLMECDLKRPADAKLEVHDTYLDIQVVVRGRESFGWSPRSALVRGQGAFDPEKDIRFYDDEPQTYYTLVPGQFTIFLPQDAHAPMVGEGTVKKAIVKVRFK